MPERVSLATALRQVNYAQREGETPTDDDSEVIYFDIEGETFAFDWQIGRRNPGTYGDYVIDYTLYDHRDERLRGGTWTPVDGPARLFGNRIGAAGDQAAATADGGVLHTIRDAHERRRRYYLLPDGYSVSLLGANIDVRTGEFGYGITFSGPLDGAQNEPTPNHHSIVGYAVNRLRYILRHRGDVTPFSVQVSSDWSDEYALPGNEAVDFEYGETSSDIEPLLETDDSTPRAPSEQEAPPTDPGEKLNEPDNVPYDDGSDDDLGSLFG